MKKVTIVTSTEHESMLLDQLGKARLIRFQTVPPSEYEGFEESFTEEINFPAIYKKLEIQYEKLIESEPSLRLRPKTPDEEELKEFAQNPEEMTEKIVQNITEMRVTVEEKKLLFENVEIKRVNEIEKLKKERDSKKSQLRSEYKTERDATLTKIKEIDQKLYSLKSKAKSLKVLSPEELKKCSAAGVAQTEVIKELETFFKTRSNGSFKSYEISDDESLIFFFVENDDQKLIEFLFLVYEVINVYDVFQSGDLLLVLDPARIDGRVKEYEAQVAEAEKELAEAQKLLKSDEDLNAEIARIDEEYEEAINAETKKYETQIEEKKKQYESEIAALREEWALKLAEVRYYENYLLNYSQDVPVLRNEVLSVLQGWVPNDRMADFEKIIKSVSENIGETPYYKVEEPEEDDRHIPTPKSEMPAFLNNAWILTQLRGWPSMEELNPAYISVLIFCFQFGLMFGDIGQGAIYLLIGLLLYKRFDRGMMKYLTALFVPMGIAAVTFGFMYDSIFLNEHLITHWLHEAHIELPFAYPIMPNPIHETPNLLNLIFMIGAIEVVFGSILGAINAYKRGDMVAIIGEHGLGMGMYVLGLYLSAGNMFTEGLDVIGMLGNWPFKVALLGLGMSTVEPILHSLQHGHGLGVEAMGEAVGGFLMTFVEGLANMFSFLRLAAFALAHASLAGAATSMGEAIGSPIGALVMMNVIALTFEFVSSSVQSLRLLYYEFMGKFFHGEGVPFKPFKLRNPQPLVE